MKVSALLVALAVAPAAVAAGTHRRADFPEKSNKAPIRSSAGGAPIKVDGTLLTTIVETLEDGTSQWRVVSLDLDTGCVGKTTAAYPWDAENSSFQGHTSGDGAVAFQVVTNGEAFMLGVDAPGNGDMDYGSCNLETPYQCLAHDGTDFWGCTTASKISKWSFGDQCQPRSGGNANILLDMPVLGGKVAIDPMTKSFWQRWTKPSTDDPSVLWYGNWGTSLDTHNTTAEIMSDDETWDTDNPSDMSFSAPVNSPHGIRPPANPPNVWWTGPVVVPATDDDGIVHSDDDDAVPIGMGVPAEHKFVGMFTGPDLQSMGGQIQWYPPSTYAGGSWAHGGAYNLLLVQTTNGTEPGAAMSITLGDAITGGQYSSEWCTEYPGSEGTTDATLGEWVFVDTPLQ